VVHLDLKPDNILIKDRHVKISDFGISRFVKDDNPEDFNYGEFPK